MSKEFEQADRETIKNLVNAIKSLGGFVHMQLLADLSMSTDLIVSMPTSLALCVQLTSQGGAYLKNKANDWEEDLHVHWKLDRGLLVSYIPTKPGVAVRVAKCILNNCVTLPLGSYTITDLD